MIEYFYVNGDSFAFGQELGPPSSPASFYDFTYYHRKHCYSGIMADTISGLKQYKNSALPGGSNERAYRKTITDVSEALTKYKPENIFVTISLTHAYRREFYMNSTKDWYPHLYTFEPAKRNPAIHNLWNILINEVSDDVGIYMYDMLQTLGIQNFLIKNKIPYLFTSSMGHEGEDLRLEKSVPKTILEQIYKPRYYYAPSFNTFARIHDYDIGPGLHPLVDAHKAWAQHLLDHINKHNLFSNKDLL